MGEEAAVDAAAASAISVYVKKLQPDVPDSSAKTRLLPELRISPMIAEVPGPIPVPVPVSLFQTQ